MPWTRYDGRMNRRAVVSFLVLAAVVGFTASLDESRMASIGERLIAFSDNLEAHSTYTPLSRFQTAGARVAFLEEGDYGGWDTPAHFDGGYGSAMDYYSTPSVAEPQYYDGGCGSGWDCDTSAAPVDWGDPDGYGTMYTPTVQDSAWPPDNYDYNFTPANPGIDYNFDSMVTSPEASWVDYNPITLEPDGRAWPPSNYDYNYAPESGQSQQDLWNLPTGWRSGEYDTPGDGSGGLQIAPGAGGGQQPVYYYTTNNTNNTNTTNNTFNTSINNNARTTILQQQQQINVNNQWGLSETEFYGRGGQPRYAGGSSYYAPAWYETALPGWGTVAIPLLPTQYRPDGYECRGSGTSIAGALGLAGSNFGLSLGLNYQDGNPCSYYNSYGGYVGAYGTSYGSGGSVAPQRIAPTCSITLSDSSIAYGGSSVLSWSSSNATAASLNGFGSVPLSGTRALSNQTVSRTYGITVTGAGGTGACYTTLSVGAQPPGPTCQISANPSSIRRGETVNLEWRAQNATEAALSGIGGVPLQSGRVVAPTADVTYTLALRGTGGRTGSCTVSVDVR